MAPRRLYRGMFIDGYGTNGFMVICDRRSQFDSQIGGVLREWGFGKACIGAQNWKQTLRCTLLDYGKYTLKSADLQKIRVQLQGVIKERNINTIVVLQSLSAPGVKMTNFAWNLFKPGSPFNWAGTVLNQDGVNVCPIVNPANNEWAVHWLIRRHFIQAFALSQGELKVRPWPDTLISTAGKFMENWLELLSKDYLAVDIETSTTKDIISCIGISDGKIAISVPWDDFVVAGTERWELGASKEVKEAVQVILASNTTKIGHNFTFDVFNLRQRGIEVNGPLEDTLLMSHSIFPQFRKGLQQCAAMCFAIEPWKSLHKPPTVKKGVDKWLATPEATRLYNCKDAMATVWIYEKFQEWLS